jgi:hypothetical protein
MKYTVYQLRPLRFLKKLHQFPVGLAEQVGVPYDDLNE